MIKTSVVGTEAVQRLLAGKSTQLADALRRKIDVVNIMLQSKIQGKLNNQLLRSHSGHLIQSVHYTPATVSGGIIKGGVQAGGGVAPYARFLEEGTQPHAIRPKSPSGVLSFDVGGKQVFAKYVNHPGTRAYRFMIGTFEENQLLIHREMQKAVDEVAQSK